MGVAGKGVMILRSFTPDCGGDGALGVVRKEGGSVPACASAVARAWSGEPVGRGNPIFPLIVMLARQSDDDAMPSDHLPGWISAISPPRESRSAVGVFCCLAPPPHFHGVKSSKRATAPWVNDNWGDSGRICWARIRQYGNENVPPTVKAPIPQEGWGH